MSRKVLGIAAAGLIAAGCSKAGDESEAKRSPLSPPPPETELPGDLEIPVEVDGAEVDPITSERLSKMEPDFADQDRRAWKLTRVLAPFDREGAVVDAVGEAGVAVSMHHPVSSNDPQPVLFLTRRGEMVAAVVEPENPFPDYHGQGGRLRRPGDPLPRVTPVTRFEVRSSGEAKEAGDSSSEKEATEPESGPLAELELAIGDEEPRGLTEEELGKVPNVVIPGQTGDSRSAWSLRHVARAVAGKEARIQQIEGKGGEAEISAAKWKDDRLTPILRANQRGQLVFHWIDAGGEPRGEPLRGVRRIHVKE